MRNTQVYRLSLDSMLASLYFVLAYFSIRIGANITLTFASITIVLVSLLYSPQDALFVALVGETLNQMVRYGPGPTTVLWLLPVLLRAAIISISCAIYRHKGDYLENHIIIYYIVLFIAAIFTTAANTGVIFLDGYLLGYPVSATIVETIFRFISGMITAVLVASIALPVVKALSKLNIGKVLAKPIEKEKEKVPSA